MEQAPGRTWRPMEKGAHDGAGFLTGLVTLWGIHTGGRLCLRTAPCGAVIHVAAVNGEVQPMDGLRMEEFVQDCLPWEGCWSWGRTPPLKQLQEQPVTN